MKLVLTVGGLGTRLRPLTYNIPKPMLKIQGKPVLQYAIEWANLYNIKDIVICAGYLADHIKNYFKDGKKFGVNIKYSIEKEKLGTAGCLKLAKDLIDDDDFILLHGDIFCNVNASNLIKFHKEKDATCTLVVHESKYLMVSDLVEFNKENKVVRFWKRPHSELPPTKFSNAGLHVFSPKIINYIPDGYYSLENDLIPELINSGEKLYAYPTEEFIMDMGTPKKMKELTDIIKAKGL